MRTKRIHNPKLQTRKPISGRSNFTQYRQQSGGSFYALSDPNVTNIFSALHLLFDIEWAYGLRPTSKDCEVCFKFEERLPSVGPHPQEDLNNFKNTVEYLARLRDKLENGKITETEYYFKKIKFPVKPIEPDKEYTASLNLDDDNQLLVRNMNEDEKAGENSELLKDLFPDFSYV